MFRDAVWTVVARRSSSSASAPSSLVSASIWSCLFRGPRQLARHRMSPCSNAISCQMNPARSPDASSTSSIHRDCQSESKIVPPAERAHRHLRMTPEQARPETGGNERSRCRGRAGAPPRYYSSNRVSKYGLLIKRHQPARRQGRPSPLHGCAWFADVRCF